MQKQGKKVAPRLLDIKYYDFITVSQKYKLIFPEITPDNNII